MAGYFVGVYEYSKKILMKNIEERLTSLAVVAASGQALHLCRVAR
jgi:hypothetical protein